MKILILASNPRKDLNLDHEIRDLRDVIERSYNHEEFDVEDALAVRVKDLQDLLFRHKPQIVHFCGHGSGPQGLVFEGNNGEEQWVRAEALSDLFRLFSSDVECVLLNACYSEEQANAIVNHIDYVIGVNQEIQDDAAIAFSTGFYRALGYDCTIEQAFEFGRNAILLEISGSSKTRSAATDLTRKAQVIDVTQSASIPEHLKPILRKNETSLNTKTTVSKKLLPEEIKTIQSEIKNSLEAGTKSSLNKDKSKPLRIRFLGISLILLAVFALGYVGVKVLSSQDKASDEVVVDDSFKNALVLERETRNQMSQSPLTEEALDQIIENWGKAIGLMNKISSSDENYQKSVRKKVEYENLFQYCEGLRFGIIAANLAQNGEDNSFEEWNNINQLWGQGIAKLSSVPAEDPTYEIAMEKKEEYQSNQNVAVERAILASFQQAVRKANQASKLIVIAKSRENWIQISVLWGEASTLMKQVPNQCPCNQIAQGKVSEYQKNQIYAREKAASLVD